VSFLHLVANHGGLHEVGYVESAVKTAPEVLKPQGELSLVLSAAVGTKKDTTITRTLLKAGASPHDTVRLRRDGFLEHTVWQIFCAFFAAQLVSGSKAIREYDLQPKCQCLEYFLEVGVDPNCFIVLSQTDVNDHEDFQVGEPATHIISLEHLVQQLKPPNFQSLSKLMKNCDQGFFQKPGVECVPSMDDREFDPQDYLPFSIDMQHWTPDDKLFESNLPEDDGKRSWFIVHSIVWRNARVSVPDLKIRIY
jgi:hypothetical protein